MTYISAESLHYAEVQVSEILESHGFIDPYFFDIDFSGKLISPGNKRPVEEVIIVANDLGRAEYFGFKKIEEGVNKRNLGYVVWISPPYEGFYKVSKIIISKIVYEEGKKKLLNRSIITNWDRVDSILVAQELTQLSEDQDQVFRNTKDVRTNPIFIGPEKEEQLAQIFEQILDRSKLEMIRTGADFTIKEKYMKTLLGGGLVPLGDKPLGCDPDPWRATPFQVFSGEKKILCCTCPECGKEIMAEIYDGEIYCPKDKGGCGAKAAWRS